MKVRGRGQVVAISSLAGVQPLPRLSTYCASKAAVDYELEALHWALKPHGIRVTTICPGFVDTDMTVRQGVPKRWLMSVDQAVATRASSDRR